MADDTHVLGPDDDQPTTVGEDVAYEVIDEGRRYVLGATDEGYGVWDKGLPDEPIDRFPASDEGFDRAQDLFGELTRIDRNERQPWRAWMRVATLAGIAVWVTAGIAWAIYYGFNRLSSEIPFTLIQLVDGTAYRVWVGGTAAMITLSLLSPPLRVRATSSPFRGLLARGLITILVIGVVEWLVGGVISAVVDPNPLFSFANPTSEVSLLSRVGTLLQGMGFRLTIGATIGLALLAGDAYFGEDRNSTRPTTPTS